MQKREKILLVAASIVVAVALIFGGYVYFSSGGEDAPMPADTPHFAIMGVTSAICYAGDNLVVRANVTNDEPDHEVAVPTTMTVTITPDPNNASSRTTVTAVPTTILKMVRSNGTQDVIAGLTGSGGVNIIRTTRLTLTGGERTAVSFDFGRVPAGSYVVTVTATDSPDSAMSKSVSVYGAPALDEWTVTGDIAFMLVNLRYDSVDVKIRNDGPRAVNISDSQYRIFVNVSDDDGVPLRELNQTAVPAGKTVTVHATIPAAGRYYLDHFAIKVPGRTALLNISVKTWMDLAA